MGTRAPRQPHSSDIMRPLRTDSAALREAEQWVRRRIWGLSDQEARYLYELYRQSYRAMLDGLTLAYNADGTPQYSRRADLLRQMEREMDALLSRIDGHIQLTLDDALLQGYYGRAWTLDMATLPDVPITAPRLPAEAIRAMLIEPYLGTEWHDDLGYNFAEYVTRIKRSLTQSLIAGEGMAAAQRRLRNELGIQTNRREGFTRNFYRTLLIARNEIMRASNQGAMAIYEQNQDVLSGWEWVATRAENTCPQCQALDGKRFSFDSPQIAPPGGSHIGCRCTPAPVLIDVALMDRITDGPRQTYADWARVNGLLNDGGLTSQRGADAPQLNTA